MSVSVPSPASDPSHDDGPCGSQLPAGVAENGPCFAVRGRGHGTGRIRSLFNQRVSVEDVLDAESFYWQGASLGTVIERATVHGRQRYDRFDASQVVIDWRDA